MERKLNLSKNWILFFLILFFTVIGGFFTIPKSIIKEVKFLLPIEKKVESIKFLNKPYKLGLDLQGGTHLLYEADLSQIKKEEKEDAVNGLRDVIERRVNLFGVKEPVVQVQKTGKGYNLIVDLAGVKDPAEAIKEIGKTPYLEFRKEMSKEKKEEIIKMLPESQVQETIKQIEKETGKKIKKEELSDYLPLYEPTELTGRYLKSAKVDFDQQTFEPKVLIQFNDEGARIFAKLTKENVGKRIAIYIDNQLISAPVVREEITGGKAEISGDFSLDEAKELARNLSAGALPVPIKLISQQTIGPSLGKDSIEKSLRAGILGFLLVVLCMILVYRFSGFLASITLFFYSILLLLLFKLVPVTLTLSGIAGFILSLGMAVDANVLIYERLKEELESDNESISVIDKSFSRAWPAIRDGHLTTLITCIILFLFASGFVQGFALTLGLGMICSMFSAMIITKILMQVFYNTRLRKIKWIWTR